MNGTKHSKGVFAVREFAASWLLVALGVLGTLAALSVTSETSSMNLYGFLLIGMGAGLLPAILLTARAIHRFHGGGQSAD